MRTVFLKKKLGWEKGLGLFLSKTLPENSHRVINLCHALEYELGTNWEAEKILLYFKHLLHMGGFFCHFLYFRGESSKSSITHLQIVILISTCEIFFRPCQPMSRLQLINNILKVSLVWYSHDYQLLVGEFDWFVRWQWLALASISLKTGGCYRISTH